MEAPGRILIPFGAFYFLVSASSHSFNLTKRKGGKNISASTFKNEPEMNRREFVKTAAAGAAGLALMGLPAGKTEAVEKYPHWGEVVVIRDEGASKGPVINGQVVRGMLEESIKALTNGGGWQSLIPSYQPGEIVGIKVNAQIPKIATQPKVVAAIIHGLVGIGIPKDKIVGKGDVGSEAT